MVDNDTPKVSVASSLPMPPSNALTTRFLKSNEYAVIPPPCHTGH